MQPQPPIRGVWRDDAPARAVYAEAAGIHRLMPMAVAVPADADDVASLVRWAAREGIALTARGSGSSMAGGAVGTGVVVDLSDLTSTGSVDASTRRIVVGAGVVCDDVQVIAKPHGLRLPVDPSSSAFCSIGGMTSTNAAGSRTLRYGQMNAWVHGVECVFADGSRAWVRRGEPVPEIAALSRFASIAADLRDAERRSPGRRASLRKNSSGYGLATWAASGSLVDLLVGSEGTLAVFTSIELQLAPIPAFAGTVVAAFASLEAATTAAAIAAELNASACELLDRTFLDIARSGGTIPVPEVEAVLIVELEEPSAARLAQLISALDADFRSAGATSVETSVEPSTSAALWKLRHAASPLLAAMSDRFTSMQVIEDGAVPPHRLAEYVRGVREILRVRRFQGVMFGHAGDGHIHANVLVDVREPDWRERLEDVFADAVSLTLRLDGTMTGEHGDGRLRAGTLDRMWPHEVVGRFRAVKAAFDPLGVLNPGVKFADRGAPLLGAQIKYDPAAEPHPEPARRVLDRVQRERLWNRSRLELLDEEMRR